MRPTSPEIVEIYRLVAVWGIGVIGLLITTIVIMFNARQNKLSRQIENTVKEDDFEKRLAEVGEQRIAFHNETNKKLDEINRTIQTIAAQAVELGRIDLRVEMLEKREAYMGNWKHETVDPYIPGEINSLTRRVSLLEEELRTQRNNLR